MIWGVLFFSLCFGVNSTEYTLGREDKKLDILYSRILKSIHDADMKGLPASIRVDLFKKELFARSKLQSIYYRASNNPNNKKLLDNLEAKKTANIKGLIRVTTALLKESLSVSEKGLCLLSRAQAFDYFKQTSDAIADYEALIALDPHSENAINAGILLNILNVKSKRYEQNIAVLLKIKIAPSHKKYSDIMEALSQSYTALHQTQEANHYLEKEILAIKRTESHEDTESAVMKYAIMQWIENYFNLHMHDVPENFLNECVHAFERLHILTYLGTAMRSVYALSFSHQLFPLMDVLQKKITSFPISHNEKLKIWETVLEIEINNNLIEPMDQTLHTILKYLHAQPAETKKEQKNLISKEVQEHFIRLLKIFQGKMSKATKKLQLSFLPIQHTFTDLIENFTDGKARLDPDIEYNIAESLLSEKKYDEAIKIYTHVIEQADSSKSKLAEKAQLRKIVAMYGILLSHHVVGENPTLSQKKGSQASLPSDMGALVQDFIQAVEKKKKALEEAHQELYLFEACRLKIQQIDKKALMCVEQYIEHFPQSPLTPAGISLVMDMYLATSQWNKILIAGNRYLLNPHLPSIFRSELSHTVEIASLKSLDVDYASKNFSHVLQHTEQMLVRLQALDPKRRDLLMVGINAAIQVHDLESAKKYYQELSHFGQFDDKTNQVTIALALELESRYKIEDTASFMIAASKQKSFLKETEFLKKTLFIAWSASDAHLAEALPVVCVQNANPLLECYKFRLLLELAQAEKKTCTEKEGLTWFQKAQTQSEPFAGIALLGALRCASFLKPFVQENLIDRLSVQFKKMDASLQLVFLPQLTDQLPPLLRAYADGQIQKAPLKMDKHAIEARTLAMNHVESVLQKMASFPWLSIKMSAIFETSRLFQNMSSDLSHLAPPSKSGDSKVFQNLIQEMKMPFEKKGQDLKIALLKGAQNSAIELKWLKQWFSPLVYPMDEIPVTLFWKEFKAKWHEEEKSVFQKAWIENFQRAFEQKRISFLLYLLGEAIAKKWLTPENEKRANALIFTVAHALSEAVVSLPEDPVSRFYKSMTGCAIEELAACQEQLKGFFAVFKEPQGALFQEAFVTIHLDALIHYAHLEASDYPQAIVLKLMQGGG